jgi:hypothetical protein
MRENILLICGSLNQTTQMHQIAQQMGEYNCYFTPYYADGIEDMAARIGLLNFTVLGGRHQRDTRSYLSSHNLSIDERGQGHDYDLVITSSDLIIQGNIRRKRMILVQEGITEPEGRLYRFYKTFPFLPRYIANTATSGLSNAYDIFCVASEGYARNFIRKGVRAEKIAVTGIPNFDQLQNNRENDFPLHDYVLVATTPYRETFRGDDRMAFLRKCGDIAAGRPLIFKLHPTENSERATREIRSLFQDALIFTHGNVNHMIANAAVVITQQSTCTFVAVALNKETHTSLDLNELRRIVPIQNNGTSARQIAGIANRLLHTPMPVLAQIRMGYRTRPRWEQGDAF